MPSLLRLPPRWIAVGYIAIHLFLDWVSFIKPFGATGITPCNPTTGLGLALACGLGRKYIPLIPVVTLFSAVFLRESMEPVSAALCEGGLSGAGYALAALLLTGKPIALDPSLGSVREVGKLLVIGILGSAVTTLAIVASLYGLSLLQEGELPRAALQYWIGDVIGIVVVAPAGLLILTGRHASLRDGKTILLLALTLALLTGTLTQQGALRSFYFLSFPIILIALKDGIGGVAWGLVLMQAELLVAVRLFHVEQIDVVDFQLRMFALSVTGLVAGSLITERHGWQAQLSATQKALAEVAMRGSMGEFGAAIAHEVNQPLSAAGTYLGMASDSLAQETLRDPTVLENTQKAVAQIRRASKVVERVRALVRLAKSDARRTSCQSMIGDVVELLQPDAQKQGVALKVDVESHLPAIVVDRLQIEQALVNLVRNALEALAATSHVDGRISIFGRMVGKDVAMACRTTDRGSPLGFSLDVLQPFNSSKPDGLGIGLSLCRSIARANGGRLVLEPVEVGASISLRFPT